MEHATLIYLVLPAFYFALASAQSLLAHNASSDSAAHLLIIRSIRRNHHRLDARLPVINDCYCGATPLYTHWLLSFLNPKWLDNLSYILNATIMALYFILLTYSFTELRIVDITNTQVNNVLLLTMLSPILFHAKNARNFGLSARGLGLLALTAFAICCSKIIGTRDGTDLLWWALAGSCAWLVLGLSTFAAQALIFSLPILMVFGFWQPTLCAIFGSALFVALHPKYSIAYIQHTIQYLRAYKNDLAPVYILSERFSIWRDLYLDIPARLKRGDRLVFFYAYGNSFIIFLFLCPVALTVPLALSKSIDSTIYYSFVLALSSIVIFFGTSFRRTRFLGEPERYLESFLVWINICAVLVIPEKYISWILFYYALLVLAQFWISYKIGWRLSSVNDQLQVIASAIRDQYGSNARVLSNNQQITYFLMRNDWQFAALMVAGQPFCSLSLNDAFSKFPIMRPEACIKVARDCGINVLVVDKRYSDMLVLLHHDSISSIMIEETEMFMAIGVSHPLSP